MFGISAGVPMSVSAWGQEKPPVEPLSSPADFAILAGQWKSETPGSGVYLESWSVGTCGQIIGAASMTSEKGKIILEEVLQVQWIGKHLVYIAAVNRQQPVLFTWSSKVFPAPTGRKAIAQWTFENGEHDYPQRIVYMLFSDHRLLAWVEGRQGAKIEKEEFWLERAAPQPEVFNYGEVKPVKK